jgi:hypothetical protein
MAHVVFIIGCTSAANLLNKPEQGSTGGGLLPPPPLLQLVIKKVILIMAGIKTCFFKI